MESSRIFLLALFAGAVGVAFGQEARYLSPDGNDAGAGTREQPWQSLAKANDAARPGLAFVLLPGRYEGCIEPGQSGRAGAAVAYRADQPGTVTLLGGTASDGGRMCLRLRDRSHVEIAGFLLRPSPGIGWFQFHGVRHSVLRDCDMDDVRGARPAECRDCHHNRFVDLRCTRANNIGQWGHVAGDMWNNYASSHNVFERVTIRGAGHRPFGLWLDCTHNVLRECVFDCRWGRNFEFFSTQRLLMERCIVTNGFDGSGSADGRAKLFVVDSIVRRNLIYRNHYGPIVANSYTYEKLPTFGMLRSRIYHNTWYRNHDYGLQLIDQGQKPETHHIAGNIVQNNLFADNDPGGDGVALFLGTNVAPDNRFVANLLWGGRPESPVVRLGWPGNESLAAAAANLHASGWFAGNLAAPPQFLDSEGDSYGLAPGSPAIDAGQPLARTRAAGQGRVVAVTDARCFYDGFGIEGETGDEIRIGTATARVLQADVEGDTLLLDRDVAWDDQAPVHLPHVGDGPDLGAYERGMDTGPTVPKGLRVQTMETATAMVVRTDFELADLETWHYYWNFSRQHHTDSRIDDTTAFSGQRSMRVYATEQAKDRNDALLSCDIRPRWWDIDRFPFVRFAYRIPPGVPVGVWLHPFEGARSGAPRVCIGGSPARAVGSAQDLARHVLLDDGEWHEATIDARLVREVFADVRLLKMLRFYTHRNGKHGDQFWFDDFRILPAAGE